VSGLARWLVPLLERLTDMLRLLALVLLLANGVYFAWGNGYLLPYGFGPAQQSEPQRLAQQIQPDAIKVLSAKEFKRIEDQIKAEQEHKDCLQAGPFDEEQSTALRKAMTDVLPADAWQMNEVNVSVRWILYMGKYASADVLAKKRAEVTALNMKSEALENATLEPGFSLGGFETKVEADAALARLGSKVHTARVVQERPTTVVYQLKFPAVTAAQQSKLAGLRDALGSKPLRACN
jgi:hypothetical protein